MSGPNSAGPAPVARPPRDRGAPRPPQGRAAPSSDLATYELGLATGPTLVLMHGNGDAGRCWPDAVRRWGTAYRLVGVDARGHGKSPRFTREQLERPGEVFADDAEQVLADVVASADGAPVIAVGHSLGASALTEVLSRRADLVVAAVLIDPPWDQPLVVEPRPEVGAARVEFIEGLQRDPERALRAHADQNPGWPEGEAEAWLEAKMHLDLPLIALGSGRPRTPWPELVPEIRTPTLVVTGNPDTCLVNADSRALVAELGNPAIELRVVPGCGHYVRQGDADTFHKVVDPWLETVVGR